MLLEEIVHKPYWLDLGAGENILIKDQPGAALAIGIDIEKPDNPFTDNQSVFCLASIYALPIKSEKFDFVTSRYTFEHLEKPEVALAEIDRVMKSGGRFILQTSNIKNPFVFLSSLIPFKLKKRLLRWIFKEIPSGTFKTYYRMNRPSHFKRQLFNLKLQKLLLIEDIFCQSRLLFYISFIYFRLLRFCGVESFSNNIIAVYQKGK
jgi:SAM-dependent methyltransferase